MIDVTPEARALVQRLLAGEGKPQGGLRITLAPDGDNDGDSAFELEVADRPLPADQVHEVDGVRLFVDSRAATELDGGQLAVEEGELALVLPEAATVGG